MPEDVMRNPYAISFAMSINYSSAYLAFNMAEKRAALVLRRFLALGFSKRLCRRTCCSVCSRSSLFLSRRSAFSTGPATMDLAAYVFLRASTWPDEIRRHGNQYDHPHWHYINYPLKPPAFHFEPGGAPDDDILYGISQCEKTLSDKSAPVELRA